MDAKIRIADREVPVRKTGGTVLRYKRQFGREFLADLQKILVLRAKLTPDTTPEELTVAFACVPEDQVISALGG